MEIIVLVQFQCQTKQHLLVYWLLTEFHHPNLSHPSVQGVSSIHAGATYSMAVSVSQLYFWGLTKSTSDATMYPKPVRDMCGWDVRSVGCS